MNASALICVNESTDTAEGDVIPPRFTPELNLYSSGRLPVHVRCYQSKYSVPAKVFHTPYQ